MNLLNIGAFELPVVIAHRGASAVAPENTSAAIREALRMGARVIEFDVRGTVDGGLVLFHDDDLKRVTGLKGSVEAITLDKAKLLEVGIWFGDGAFAGESVIELSEAIELCREGGAIPLIERKSGEASAYAEVIRHLGAEQEVIVQSFDWEFLEAFRTELPQTPIGALGSKTLSRKEVEQLSALKPEWVGWKHNDLTIPLLELFHSLGCQVALWTVNDPAIAKQWVHSGVKGIITDQPDVMISTIKDRRIPVGP